MRLEPRRRLGGALQTVLRSLAGPTMPLPPSAVLRRCPACGRDPVAVLERVHLDGHYELLRLRCAGCGHERDVVATARECEALLRCAVEVPPAGRGGSRE